MLQNILPLVEALAGEGGLLRGLGSSAGGSGGLQALAGHIGIRRDMLRDGWPTVEAIADALLSQGTLSGFEVADICQRFEPVQARQTTRELGPLAAII